MKKKPKKSKKNPKKNQIKNGETIKEFDIHKIAENLRDFEKWHLVFSSK